MKKILKSRIFAFILGALIFGSIGVAASQLFANQIEFRPTWKKSNGEDIVNVEEAINELYNVVNEGILDKLDLKSSKVDTRVSYGDKATRTINYNFSAGSYLIHGVSGYVLHNKSIQASDGVIAYPKPLDETNCTYISGKFAKSSASSEFGSSKLVLYTSSSIYTCKFTSNTTVTFTTETWNTSSNEDSNLMISVIKLD